MAYLFTLGGVPLPVTPKKLEIKLKGGNKTVSLINGGEINIIKDGKLLEISFECVLPQFNYPFAYYENGAFKPAVYFINHFEDLKGADKPFPFKILRNTPGGEALHNDSFNVTMENFYIKEDTANGQDIAAVIELKEYKRYGSIRLVKTSAEPGAPVAAVKETPRAETKEPSKSYLIKSGDTLYNIAKKELGDANKWKQLYELNKEAIETAAKQHGKASSSNGWWIYPGCGLRLS